MKKTKEKIIEAWGLADGNHIYFPLFYTKKATQRKRFVEDIVKLEIKIIKRELLLKQKLSK
jgi:hypothetical protein